LSDQGDRALHRLLFFALVMGIGALTIYSMIVGRDILLPLVVAFVVWYFVNILATAIRRYSREVVPGWLAVTLGAIGVLVLATLIGNMVGNNLATIAEQLPAYEARFDALLANWSQTFGVEHPPRVAELLGRVDFRALIRASAAEVAGLAGNAGLVLLYVFFLLLEQNGFNKKLTRLFDNPDRERRARVVIARIHQDLQTYLRIKVLLALLTALFGWAIMAWVDLEFASFWAALLFLFYFVPTIGTPLALLGPALFALVQFESLTPFLIVVVPNLVVQVVVANFVETALMGRSLNLSPFVSIVALVVFGTLWGLIGMVLCVPILVAVVIILAHFERTRGMAILLSSKGDITE
jgi:predicted PurR-regulated permease PerM